MNIDIPLPKPTDAGILAADTAAATSTGYPTDWTFGRRPTAKISPEEQAREDAVGRATGELEDPDAADAGAGDAEAGGGLLEEAGEDLFAFEKELAEEPVIDA